MNYYANDTTHTAARRAHEHETRSVISAERHRPAPVERHRSGRLGWLRAAVLGADDGVVSTASLLVGVSSATGSRSALIATGIAALAAGAMSMAAGEWVSVSSQRDGELADLEIERGELSADPAGELAELAGIYVRRGLPVHLAWQVARSLSTDNVLDAHAHDELGLDPGRLARPAQAATASAASFAIGALVPTITAVVVPAGVLTLGLAVTALVALGVLGATGAEIGGGRRWRGAMRVMIGGGLAMLVTGLVGRAVHASGL